jgi:Zn-dependent protease with chaperone function
MIPIPVLVSQPFGQPLLTLVLALAPAIVAWWNDRRLVSRRDDPALPEMLADRRRLNVRLIAIAAAAMIVLGGRDAAWGIPLLIVFLIAAAYPLRTRLLGETWSFGAYLWHTAASVVGGFGFWIALALAPSVMVRLVRQVGTERWWLLAVLAAAIAGILIAWEAWYPRIWLRTHAAERLTSPELTPRFEEVVRRAGTVVPQVYRVGPRGSRFVNAVALPSVRHPSVAMGNALLELLGPDETVAIFAHEVAHFDHLTPRYVRRTQRTNRALIVGAVALPLLAAFTGVPWAWSIAWLWPLALLLALGRRVAKSQQHETESDRRAAALCGDPEALVRGLVTLHLHARIPRRYALDTERAATHPSLVRRIQAIRAGGAAAIDQLGSATVIRSTREGSWVVLEDVRSYWLDGVPAGADPQLATLCDAASSYRAVNYQDLVELRVAVVGDARSLTARTRAGDRWSVPIAADDVARVQRALDVVDLRLGKAGPAASRLSPKLIALAAFALSILAGQAGVVLAPILVAMAKPSASALAALGAMSIVRAVFGALEGSGWFDATIVRAALAGLALTGILAIYVAVRLVRAGEANAHLRLTMAVLPIVAAITGAGVIAQAAQMSSSSLVGAPLMGAFATALFGVAAALFTVQTRWSKPAGYAGLVVAAAVAAVGIDRTSVALQRTLVEDTARATLEGETRLGSMARALRVSPDGGHFLAARMPASFRAATVPKTSLVTGRVGGPSRDVVGLDGDFVDDVRVMIVAPADSGLELRLEGVEDGVTTWADTVVGAALSEPRLFVDRAAMSWAIVATDADSDRTVVLGGRVGEKGARRRAAIPDTVPVVGEPIVFDQGATVIVPALQRQVRLRPGVPALALWSLAFGGFDGPGLELWRVHGDSVRPLAPMRGTAQCGAPSGDTAACIARRMRATSLYTVTETGVATEVARVPLQDLGVVTIGPGPRIAAMGFDRAIVIADLVSRRLTRIPMPSTTPYSTDVAVGPGWIVTLGYDGERTSVVRRYRTAK